MWSYGNFKLQNKNFAPIAHLNSFLDENKLTSTKVFSS